MKIVWAYEPFHQEKTQTSKFYKMLREIHGPQGEVEASFLVTRTENDLVLSFDVPEKQRFTDLPLEIMKSALKKAQVKLPDSQISVLDHPTFSTSNAVDYFLKTSKKKNADLIALFTHSRKGFKRLLVGSFAETAIHTSPISLLIANPKTLFSKAIKRILFASDFTEDSKKHFLELLQLCARLKAELIVVHAARMIYNPAYDELTPEVLSYRKQVDQYREWLESQASQNKVKIKIQIFSEFSQVSDIALKFAKKTKADLIAVAAKSGPTTALMGGSTTRQIVRSSTRPVLVLK
ncbi:MAG: universal stress protein [Bdellovibrionales bacterium]